MFMLGKYWPEGVRVVFSSKYAQEERNRDIPYLKSFEYLNTSPSVRRVLILAPSVTLYYLDNDYVRKDGGANERSQAQSRRFRRLGTLALEDDFRTPGIIQIEPELNLLDLGLIPTRTCGNPKPRTK